MRKKSNDDKICVIHVGPHKTGSTTLQEALPLDLREPIRPKQKAALDAVKRDNYEVPLFPNQKFDSKNHAGFFCKLHDAYAIT